MPQKNAASKNKKTSSSNRDYDRESGKNRVSGSRRPPPVIPSSDEEDEFEDSDVESVLSIPAKDVSIRKTKKTPKPQRVKRTDPNIEGEEPDLDNLNDGTAPLAPHMALLLAATYFTPLMSISAPTISSYIPDCYNLFTIAYRMMDLLFDNWKLHEICPQFSSVTFYAFIGYTYYYAVLRARAAVPGLNRSREEKRCLQRLEQTCHPSGWPVPGPIAAIVIALGYVKPSDTYYSYIVPALPDFSPLDTTTTKIGLNYISRVVGGARTPIIPAMVQFVHNYANGTAKFKSGRLIPTSDNIGNGTPAITFLGITSATATNAAFQTLAFSSGWNAPVEDESLGSARLGMARRYWNHQSVPTVEGKGFADVERFLCLSSDYKTEWIRQAAAMTKVLDRFFPGGTNLEALGNMTTVHSLTHVEVDATTARVGRDNAWYRGRSNWTFKYYGFDDTEQGRILTRLGVATGTLTEYETNVVPYGNVSAEKAGPFFVQSGNNYDATALPRFESFGQTDVDPLARIGEQLAGTYNAQGLL